MTRLSVRSRSGQEAAYLDQPPTADEVTRAIKQLSAGKTAGADSIPPEIYKEGGRQLVRRLVQLFTRTWDKENVPRDFENAQIVHTFKRKETVPAAMTTVASQCCPLLVKYSPGAPGVPRREAIEKHETKRIGQLKDKRRQCKNQTAAQTGEFELMFVAGFRGQESASSHKDGLIVREEIRRVDASVHNKLLLPVLA